MEAPREVYAEKALSQIPRILSLQDRNPYSPTYGCFHRDYWLYKTSDFPDAVRQFGVHALALAYARDFPGNPYRAQPKIRDWAIAGLDFWSRIQHSDGSFDEFYPYERGWVGPSGFTLYAATEAYELLRDEIPDSVSDRLLSAIQRCARFIAAGQTEEDHLANHHAMACLAVRKAQNLTNDPLLDTGFERLWDVFRTYHNSREGWSREYDGFDAGYLSATISFLAKIYQSHPDPDIFGVLRSSVEFSSYFVYPDGSYGGTVGSRNTEHFYPHGFEILAPKIPLAASVAERMLKALAEGKLVPPDIMSDRYVSYRIPEFLQAYLDYAPRPTSPPSLPYEQGPFARYFPEARVYTAGGPDNYLVANLGKGGVAKIFHNRTSRQVLSDSGIIGQLRDGTVVTSQWVDPGYECRADDHGWEVRGPLHAVSSYKMLTPFSNLLFRAVLVAFGWNSRFSHWLKGAIRRRLMLKSRRALVYFIRRFESNDAGFRLTDEIEIEGDIQFRSLSVGNEFSVRLVPQSRYFQNHELTDSGYALDEAQCRRLNQQKSLQVIRDVESSNEYRAVTAVVTVPKSLDQ